MISLWGVSKENALEQAKKYLNSAVTTPFFIVIEDGDALEYFRKEFNFSLPTVFTSDFCQEDSFPDFDKLHQHLVQHPQHGILEGYGESVLFSGYVNALHFLKDLQLSRKILVFLRGVTEEVLKMKQADVKFDSRRVCFVDGEGTFTVTRYAQGLSIPVDATGFRNFLKQLESTTRENWKVSSDLPLCFSKSVECAYHLISFPGKTVPESYLTDKLWEEYLCDSEKECESFGDWRYFLKEYQNPSSSYSAFILEQCDHAEEYKSKFLTKILDIPVKDTRYSDFYEQRKENLRFFSLLDLKSFISFSMQKESERLYYMSDQTEIERKEILKVLAEFQDIPKAVSEIYPELEQYLGQYTFTCNHGDQLTAYFQEYKRSKVINSVDSTFLEQVNDYAKEGARIFNSIDTHYSLVERHQNPYHLLYWVDALGVEFLHFLKEKSNQMGMVCDISIGKSQLPTLTAPNREFYDSWNGPKKDTKKLDSLKHNRGSEKYSGKTAEHLVEELSILSQVLEEIRHELAGTDVKKVILTSDHGASRLAVLHGVESKWAMDITEEYSGHCCLASETNEIPYCATEAVIFPHTSKEERYWVLANYDRFKGSRKADVEVHVGASLEEVLVPIIVISLPSTTLTFINMTNIENITLKSEQYVELFCETPV